jgi:low affinity Fe/Cu permease
MKHMFTRFAQWTSQKAGHPMAFVVAVLAIIIWAATGPIFRYSDTWQLVINTGTTIITFLMVFLIQNTQNRDMIAVQIKLDELISCMKLAQNNLLDLEDMDEDQLTQIKEQYGRQAKIARQETMGSEPEITDKLEQEQEEISRKGEEIKQEGEKLEAEGNKVKEAGEQAVDNVAKVKEELEKRSQNE